MKAQHWIAVGGVFGAIGIGVGAFGAHGLPTLLEGRGFAAEEIAKRLGTFETGARYHLYAALAIVAIGLGRNARPNRLWSVAGWLQLTGGALFSHLLYALAVVDGMRWLGAIVPIGGVLMIAGWAMIAVAATRPATPLE